MDKSIEINISAEKIWKVLIEPEYTDQWAVEFIAVQNFTLSEMGVASCQK